MNVVSDTTQQRLRNMKNGKNDQTTKGILTGFLDDDSYNRHTIDPKPDHNYEVDDLFPESDNPTASPTATPTQQKASLAPTISSKPTSSSPPTTLSSDNPSATPTAFVCASESGFFGDDTTIDDKYYLDIPYRYEIKWNSNITESRSIKERKIARKVQSSMVDYIIPSLFPSLCDDTTHGSGVSRKLLVNHLSAVSCLPWDDVDPNTSCGDDCVVMNGHLTLYFDDESDTNNMNSTEIIEILKEGTQTSAFSSVHRAVSRVAFIDTQSPNTFHDDYFFGNDDDQKPTSTSTTDVSLYYAIGSVLCFIFVLGIGFATTRTRRIRRSSSTSSEEEDVSSNASTVIISNRKQRTTTLTYDDICFDLFDDVFRRKINSDELYDDDISFGSEEMRQVDISYKKHVAKQHKQPSTCLNDLAEVSF